MKNIFRTGYTLIEILLVVAGVGTVAAGGYMAMTSIRSSAGKTKLEEDVLVLNRAVRMYQVSGGSIPGNATEEQVLDQLRLVAADPRKVVGLRGAMIDPRLAVRRQSAEEARGRNSRAYWNADTMSFEVSPTGASPGVKEFYLGPVLDSVVQSLDVNGVPLPAGTDNRKTTFDFAQADHWVWDYQNDGLSTPVGPTRQPVGDGGTTNSDATTEKVLIPLGPPGFSIAAGTYALSGYPKNLTLTLPGGVSANDAAIYFLTPGNGWVRYSSEIEVDPGLLVTAKTVTTDPDNYTDSGEVSNLYRAAPVDLELALSFSKSAYNYMELGGAMVQDTHPQAGPGSLTVTGPADINSRYLNHTNVEVVWTVDGTDPRNSGSRLTMAEFTGLPEPVSLPLGLAGFQPTSNYRVRALAVSKNAELFQDSRESQVTLGIARTTLGSLAVSYDGVAVSMAPRSQEGLPVGARTFYTATGEDPGDNRNGDPSSTQAVQYQGPVIPSGDLVQFSGRLYAPESWKAWFDPGATGYVGVSKPAAGNLYATSSAENRIYQLDALTGRNIILTDTCLFPPASVAFTGAASGRVYYVEQSTFHWRLGSYGINNSQHRDHGSLTASQWNYQPASKPSNLTAFNGSIFYIPERTDDLVRIDFNADGTIRDQYKFADITHDTAAFEGIGDIAVTPSGMLYISAVNGWASFDVKTLAPVHVVTGPAPWVWSGLLNNSSGALLGIRNSEPSRLYTVNPATGAGTGAIHFNPARVFDDLGSPVSDIPLNLPPGHYAISPGKRNVYRVDLETGRNYVVRTGLDFVPGAAAFQPATGQVFLSDSGGDFRLYVYTPQTNTITGISGLQAPGLAYVPSGAPQSLTWYNNALYFVTPGSDDLVRLTFSGTTVATCEKVDDLLDGANAGVLDGMTIGPDGVCYFANSDIDRLAYYDLGNLGGYGLITNAAPAKYTTITFTSSGQMVGVPAAAADRTRLFSINPDTGAATFRNPLQPAMEFSDITGLNDSAPASISSNYFTVDGTSPRIYRVDPLTGQNRIVNGAAPWAPGTLAFDQENQLLYYTKSGGFELGCYNLTNNTHTPLAALNDSSMGYIPAAPPENLTFFNGSLYYVAPGTDDLIRLEVVSGSVRASWKEADLRGNNGTAGSPQDIAVDSTGQLFLSGSEISARFDLTTLSGWTVLAQSPADVFQGLFAADGGTEFYGATAAQPRRIAAFNPTTAAASPVIVTAPERTIRDAASAQPRVRVVPPEGVYYAIVTGQPVLYRVNPVNGAMETATASCPVIPETVAYDPEGKIVYYTSTSQGSGTNINLYKFDPSQQRHTGLGSLSNTALAARPSGALEALTFFCGDLYYVNPGTDDLVRVSVSETAVVSADKAADITGNAKTLGIIGALAISNNGTLYLSRLDAPLLASVNFYTRGAYTELNTTTAQLGAMVLDQGNQLYAASVSTPAVIETVNPANGARSFKANTLPSRPLRDIAGLNSIPEPELPECYAVGGGNRNIYRFDPATGVTFTVTRTAPFNLEAIARDPAANVLYYLEQSGIPWRIGRYDVASKTHSVLTAVGASGNNYNAAVRPSNLFFYDNHLYFIADNTDDLVQIGLGPGGNAVTGINKAADLTDDASNFGTIGDVAADSTGTALFSDSTGRLRTFNMKVLTNVQVLGTSLPVYRGLLLTNSGGFHGSRSTAPTSLYALNRSTGAGVLTGPSFPLVTFADMAGQENSAPWTTSDSLWVISDAGNALGEFKNWNLPNVSAKTWAGMRYRGTGGTPVDFGAGNEIEGMAVTSGGVAYVICNRAVTIDGITHQRSLFRLDLNAASASSSSTPPVLTFAGSFDRVLSGFPLTVAGENKLSGLALGADGLFYVLFNSLTGTDQLLRLNSLSVNSTKRFNNVSIMGSLTGASETVTDGEDLTVSASGVMYVTDDADDRVSIVNPATAAVTSVFSSDSPVGYEGLTSHPGSGEVVASNPAADFIRRVRSGAGNDTNRFNSKTVSANVLTDLEAVAFPSGSPQNLNDPTPPYFASDNTTSLYRVNPVNGRTVLLTSTTPFPVNCVAHDAAAGLVYYIEDADSTIRLGVYNIGNDTHAILGNLKTQGAVRPTSRPQDFVWYAGSLYYLNPGSSQLVRIRLNDNGSAVVAQEVAATLVPGATWTATAAAVDGSGQLYFTAGLSLYRFNLATLSGLTTISATAGNWQSLVFTSGSAQLYGTATGSLTRIDAITAGSGASTSGAQTTPVRSFSSMTGPGTGTLPPDSPFYASNRTNRLYTINPVTGITTQLSGTAPFAVDAIALNEAAGLLYFLANTDTSTSLGSCNLSSGTYATIGALMDAPATGLTVDLRPLHLVSFQNALYYIRRSSVAGEKDDLIRVTLNAAGTAIAGQIKVADLNANNDWGDVTGAALDDEGWLYFNTGAQLRKYNLRTQTGAAVVSNSFTAHHSLLWHRSMNTLFGSPVSSAAQINAVSMTNGNRGALVSTSPVINLNSLTAGNRALPPPSLTAPPAYIVGDFSRNGTDYHDVARLNSDGSLDTGFNVGSGTNPGAMVRTAARAADGKLLIGGNFTSFNGTTRGALARLNANGSLDSTFTPSIEAVTTATPFTLNWSNLALNQGAAVSGGDTVSATTADANHGLSTGGGFSGFASQTFSNVSGSGIDMTLYYSQNMSSGPSLHGPAGSGYTAGENPDRRVTGPVALRFTNDRTSPFTPATLGIGFSEPVYFDNVLLGSLSQVGGHAEYGYFRAWDGAAASGNLVPATTFANLSAENGPLYGTAADPITVNALTNITTATPGTARYEAAGLGKEEENRHGRVQFTFTGTPVRSMAFSHWTTLTTTTTGTGGNFDPNKPFGVAQDFSMFSYGNFEIAAGGAGTKGGVAVGGNMTYGQNGGFYMDGAAGRDALVVEGNLNTNGNGALSNGNVAYGSSPDPSKINAYNGTKRQATGVIPFASIKASHLSLSTQWKALGNSAGTTISYTPAGGDGKVPVTLNAGNQTGLVVFNLDPAKLVNVANWTINGVNSAATILINIPGVNPPVLQNFSFSVNGTSDGARRVVFHYPDATTTGFSSIAVPGTVFAPKALVTVSSNGGQLLGHVIAERIELRSTYNGGQYTFTGNGLPGPSGPPLTTTAVSGGNGALTFCLSGFRRTTGLPGSVWAVKTQSDGKIVIGGKFAAVNGVARKNIARLNADGTLDTAFDPGNGPNGEVYSLLLTDDGGVLAGGDFTAWNGSPSGAKLALLTNTGQRNTAFSSPVSTAAADVVRWIQPDSSGNILIGGKFTAPSNGLARITMSGSADGSFTPGTGTGGGSVNTGVVQPDGTLLIAGDFGSFNGVARNHIIQLNPNGTPAASWNPGPGFDGLVNAVLQLPGSGFVHSGGQFGNYNGVTRNRVSVLEAETAAAGVSPWGPATLTITTVYDVE